MKRTHRTRRTARPSAADPSEGLRDSAQKIWLAGLGALERARTDGPRMFESLVEQGRNMGARAVGAADGALKAMRQGDSSGNRWEKVEKAFEERLTSSLGKLGLLTSRDVENLRRQVHDLGESVRQFMAGAADAGAKGADGAAAPGTKARRAPRAAAKAAGRRRKAKGVATPRAGAAGARKGGVRKPRKASRAPRSRS
jgi:poly(hydroxyalkanoate) granule-associated protein